MSERTMEQGILFGREMVKTVSSQKEQWRIADKNVAEKRAANIILREELGAATRRIITGSSTAPALPTLGEDFVAKQGASAQKLGETSVGAEVMK